MVKRRKKCDGDIRFISPQNSHWIIQQGNMEQCIRHLEGASERNHLEVAGSIPSPGKNNKEYLL